MPQYAAAPKTGYGKSQLGWKFVDTVKGLGQRPRMGRLFPNSRVVVHGELEFEVQPTDCSKYERELRSIESQVLHIAARSRGWDTPDVDRVFREHFKIEPLFQVTTLVLIWSGDQLVGLAGCVRHWEVEGYSLVHLCSLGFLPSIQGRGVLNMLMCLLWGMCWSDARFRSACSTGKAYATALTQSPFLMSYFDHLFELQPSPDRPVSPVAATLAHVVARRFAPQLQLEPDTLVLRNECRFFYKDLPYGANPHLNSFCDRTLRYEEGDVFVVVGRALANRIEEVVGEGKRRYPMLMDLVSA